MQETCGPPVPCSAQKAWKDSIMPSIDAPPSHFGYSKFIEITAEYKLRVKIYNF